MTTDYHARIRRVHAAIHADPAADHSLDDLADIAALSRFHFHRVFTAMTGETVAEAVRRIRLKRSAQALRRGSAAVAQIGQAHGYPNAGSFSRAFRAAYGVTPRQFRQQTNEVALPTYLAFQPGDPTMYPVTVEQQPARQIIGLPHRGSYALMGQKFAQMGAALGKAGLWPRATAMIAVYFDDPAVIPAADLRGLAAVSVDSPITPPTGFVPMGLAGGRHAAMQVTGPYSGLAQAYDWLFGTWLAHSEETPRDAPCWEQYVNHPADTAPQGLITRIYLPLEG